MYSWKRPTKPKYIEFCFSIPVCEQSPILLLQRFTQNRYHALLKKKPSKIF